MPATAFLETDELSLKHKSNIYRQLLLVSIIISLYKVYLILLKLYEKVYCKRLDFDFLPSGLP